MKKLVFFDIETGPSAAAYLFEPEFTAPRNIKDPAKIAAALEEKREEWKERLALSAVTGRVLAIGFAGGDSETVVTFDDENEGTLIRKFWDTIQDLPLYGDHRLCGWNICGFDLPFLQRRSWVWGIRPPDWVYHSGRFFHTDLMKVWCGDNPQDRISLDTAAKLFGLPGKLGKGSEFAELFEQDRNAALAYLRRDVALTQAVARRMHVL